MTSNFNINVTWASLDQHEIYRCDKRFIVVRAGRRWGKTKGAANMVCWAMGKADALNKPPLKILWVDTSQRNIDLYFEEHFKPILPEKLYKWNKQHKILRLDTGSMVVFGSAERPENLEGFGYDMIVVNEAGLILKGEKGEKIWWTSLRPMAMETTPDGGQCQVWFVGTPKGKGLYNDFILRGQSSEYPDWIEFHRTSYDRESISPEEIDALISETPGGEKSRTFRQEIMAEMIEDDDGDPVISYESGFKAMEREIEPDSTFRVVWGCDPSLGGDDVAALAKRRGQRLLEPVSIKGGRLDPEIGAYWLKEHYDMCSPEEQPDEIIIDSIAGGFGWYTHARSLGLPVRAVDWSKSPVNGERFYQRRDELWVMASKWCETGSLNGDRPLMLELVKPLIDERWRDENGKYKVEAKALMKKRLGADGGSPNRADAFVLTFSAGIELRENNSMDDWDRGGAPAAGVSWMGAW